MPMPTPKQISLDLDDEVPPPVAIPPECKPALIDLMAQATSRRVAQRTGGGS